MAVYMIDYENVKTGGLNGISRLTGSDRVIIFYSENANRLTFDLHQRLMASTAQIEYREVSVGGHNALDFQLVTYLGYLIAQEPNGQYLIISNDRGFEYVVNFWRRDGLSIGLLPYLKDPAYALQKATRTDVRPLAQPELSVAEDEPADEPANQTVEPVAEPIPDEVPVSADEPIAEPIPDEVPEPVAAEAPAAEAPAVEAPAVEAPVAEPVVAEPIVAQPVAEPVAEPVVAENAAVETPKPAQPRRTRGGRQQRKADKPAEAPAEPAKAEKPAEPRKPRVTVQPAKTVKTANASKAATADAPAPEEPDAGPVKPAVALSPQLRTELRAMLGDSVADDPELRYVIGCVEKYKTKLGLNNALVKRFGNQKASELYQKLKPLLTEKKTVSAPRKKEKAGVS